MVGPLPEVEQQTHANAPEKMVGKEDETRLSYWVKNGHFSGANGSPSGGLGA